MKKNVWILNHYAGGMLFAHGGRHYSLAKYLKEAGYAPVVFCANAQHQKAARFFDDDQLWREEMAEEIRVPFLFVKARTYTGNGKQRLLNMLDFYCNVKKTAKEYAKTHGKPDVIYASSVHPLTLVAGIQLAKKFGVKCICEVRDLWPESIVVYSTRFKKTNPLIRLLYLGEKWIYKKADQLIFTMEGAYKYIQDQGWEKAIPSAKVFYINNGVDLESYAAQREENRLEDEDLLREDTFKVVYAGSIRHANGLSELVACAELLQEEESIQFLVYGTGDDLPRLQEEVNTKNLSNIIFKGQVPKNKVPFVLAHSSVNLLNYNLQTAHVYKYGSSQNKLFEYLASGKPILSNIQINYGLIERYGCGISREIVSAREYADAILELYRLSKEDYAQMCENGRKGAADYDFKKLTDALIEIIEITERGK